MSKKKGIPLDQFLKPDTNITNWAEEDDDLGPPVLDTVPFPTAPKHQFAESAGEPSRAHPDLPDQPPWKVYIGNVPYELNPRDIEDVFKGLQIRDTHMLTHRDSGNLKGVFVEFGSQSDLQAALQQNGASIMGRSLRIDVAGARPERSRGGFSDRGPADSRERGGYGFDRPDYSSGNRVDERRGSGYSRDYDADKGGGGGFESYGRRGYEQRDDKRGFGSNYEQDERRGSFRDRPKGDYGGFSGARDEGPGRWGRSPTETPSGGRSQELSGLESTPSEHKSLSLQPAPSGASTASDGPPKPKANPFGNAKPVDTVAKLKELEERDAKRKAEEAARRRDAAAAQRQAPPEPTPTAQSPPTRILQPAGRPQQAQKHTQPSSDQQPPVQAAPAPTQQHPQQSLAASTTAQQQPAQASASLPKATPSPAAAPAAQQLPRPAAASSSAEAAPAPRAPAWGKPAQASAATQPQTAPAGSSSTAPQPSKSTEPRQAGQADNAPPAAASNQQQAQPQQRDQASRQSPPPQQIQKATQQAQQGQSTPPGFATTPAVATAAVPKPAWGKAPPSEGGPHSNPKAASATPQPSARGKGHSQTTSSQPAQNGSSASTGAAPQGTSTQKQQPQQQQQQPPPGKQEQLPVQASEQAESQERPIQVQAAKPSNAWGANRQGSSTSQSSQAATGTQFGSLNAADLQPPAAAAQQPRQSGSSGPQGRHDAPSHQQQQQRTPSGKSAAAGAAERTSVIPVSSTPPLASPADSPDDQQGWTDVASTQGATEGGVEGSEGGRGRGGRGRGRGRYSNAGPADSYRGRGSGRGRSYGNQGGRGAPAGRGPPGRGPAGRGYQGAPLPGLQQGAEVEDGWEQAGRNEGSRSSRGRGRGSSAPQVLQRQGKPANAWGQQGTTATGQQHEGRTPPGLAVQPEPKATEGQNMFELLNEGGDA